MAIQITRQTEALAARFEQANEELVGEVEQFSDREWAAICAAEQWSVGVTAHHIASSHLAITGLVQALGQDGVLPPVTMEVFDAINAEHATRYASCTRAETVELLHREGAAAAIIVRALSDDQLDRTGKAAFLGGAEISTRGLIERILIGHISCHLESMRAAVSV